MKRCVQRWFIGGILVAVIPAMFIAYRFFTWSGPTAGFLGGNSQKNITDIIDNPVGFIGLYFILWIVFGLILGAVSALVGWTCEKSKTTTSIDK